MCIITYFNLFLYFMSSFVCTFLFFIQSLCGSESTHLNEHDFKFEEFFDAFEIRKIQDQSVFDIKNPHFQEIRWSDYFILKYNLWNYFTLNSILELYFKKKSQYTLNENIWKDILFQIHKESDYINWKTEFFTYVNQKSSVFLQYLKEKDILFYNFINSQLNHEFLSLLSNPIKSQDINQVSFLNIPSVLIKEANYTILLLALFEANNFKNYFIHSIKYWARFLFIQNFKLINKKNQIIQLHFNNLSNQDSNYGS